MKLENQNSRTMEFWLKKGGFLSLDPDFEVESLKYRHHPPPLGQFEVTPLLFQFSKRAHDLHCTNYMCKSLKCFSFPNTV